MSLQYGILGFLTYTQMSGYDLAKAFDSSVKFFWYAQNSHIYLELNKLEKKGFVNCTFIPQTDKPNKKLYSITETGKKEFLRWLADEANESSKGMKNTFLMKIFFSGNVSPRQSIAKLQKFTDDCKKYTSDMMTVPASIENYSSYAESKDILYWQFTADFGNSYTKMCIEWAQNCIRQLEKYEEEHI